MGVSLPITAEYFRKRFVDLCLKSGLPGFPKDEIDQQIILKSVVLTMGPPASYDEKEINAKIQAWIRDVAQIPNLDRTTLRRALVDSGYLARSKDGSTYQIVQPGPQPELFDAAVEQVEPVEVISTAREEIARRKREYTLNK